jgi:hypothetical protein
MENAGHFYGLNPRSAGQSVINSVKSFSKIEKAESQTVDTLAIRKLHVIIRTDDPPDDAHRNRESPPRGITHDIRLRNLIIVSASFEFASARSKNVLHPFRLAAVSKSDDESSRRSKDVHRGSVDLS